MGERSVFDRLDDLERTANETREDTRKIREDTEETKRENERLRAENSRLRNAQRAAGAQSKKCAESFGSVTVEERHRGLSRFRSDAEMADFFRQARPVFICCGDAQALREGARKTKRRLNVQTALWALIIFFGLAAIDADPSGLTFFLYALSVFVSFAGIVLCFLQRTQAVGRDAEVPYASFWSLWEKMRTDANGVICGGEPRYLFPAAKGLLPVAAFLLSVIMLAVAPSDTTVGLLVVEFILCAALYFLGTKKPEPAKYRLYFRRGPDDVAYTDAVAAFVAENRILLLLF